MNAPIHPLFPSTLGYRPISEVIEGDGERVRKDLESMDRILRALKGNGNKLVLFQEHLSDENMAFIVKALEKAPESKEEIIFTGNTISLTGFSLLCSFLSSPSSQIRVLSYADNNLCDSGAIELSKVLKVNSSLKWILLRGNAIGDLGAISLADSFHLNSSLQILDLKKNKITERGARAFIDAIRNSSNTTLCNLPLLTGRVNDTNLIPWESQAEIDRLLHTAPREERKYVFVLPRR